MESVRKYLSIDDIHREYLPISKKKIRALVKENMEYRQIGGRIYVSRAMLELYLAKTPKA